MVLIILEIIGFVFSTLGLFLLIAGFARIPSRKKLQSVSRMASLLPDRKNFFDNIVGQLGRFIDERVKLPKEITEKVQEELEILEINTTASRYITDCIAKAICISIVSIPLFALSILPLCQPKQIKIFFFILGVLIFAGGILIGIGDYQHLDAIFKQRREEIDKELPPFVSLIQQTFRHDVNVPKLISDYTKTDETALTKELRTVLADMQTGSTELALVHMSKRINSIYLSETVRGLIAASRGENTTEYFFALDEKMQDERDARVKTNFMKIAPCIKRIAFLNLLNIALIYIVPLLASGLSGLSDIFNFT